MRFCSRSQGLRARLTLPEPPGRCAVVTARADGKREVRERVLRAWPGIVKISRPASMINQRSDAVSFLQCAGPVPDQNGLA
jgi:hypothetical protein